MPKFPYKSQQQFTPNGQTFSPQQQQPPQNNGQTQNRQFTPNFPNKNGGRFQGQNQNQTTNQYRQNQTPTNQFPPRKPRRRDVLDLRTSHQQKRSNSFNNFNNYNKRPNNNNNHNNNNFRQGSGENVTASNIARHLFGLENGTKKDAGLDADLFIGNFIGILDAEGALEAFYNIITKNSPLDSIVIPATTYNLPKKEIDPNDKKIRNIFIKFSIDWFNDLLTAIYRKKFPNICLSSSSSSQQLSNTTQRMEEDNKLLQEQDSVASSASGKSSTANRITSAELASISSADIFDTIADTTKAQIDAIKSHYKPSGLIYILIATNVKTDSIIMAWCNLHGYPVIQLGHHGQKKLMDIASPIERAEEFAKRINAIARFDTGFVNRKKNGASLTEDGVINMSSFAKYKR